MNPPYLIIFFSSLTVLAFEITLVRLFSIRFSYHYASLIISISMLGLVAGGIWAYMRSRKETISPTHILTHSVFSLALSYPLTFIISSVIPFDHYRALWEDIQIVYLLFFVFSLSVPFFLYGVILSSVLRVYSGSANRVYAADLTGAAGGIAWAMFLLNHTDVESIITSCAAILSVLLFFKVKKKILGTVYALCPLILCLPVLLGIVALEISPYKGLMQALKDDNARRIQTINTSHARLDIFSNPRMRSAPGLSLGYERPVPEGLGIAVDGDIAGVLLDERGMKNYAFFEHVPSALPFILKGSPVVLVAGVRGSIDVLAPYYFGAKTVYKAETNLSMLRMLHDNYGREGLHRRDLHRISGRRLLQDLPEKVDIVYLSGTGFFPAGTFGLTENYDTTVDALQYYLANMRRDGMLYIQLFVLPPPRYELRIFNNIIEALNGLSLSDHERRLVVFRTWDTMNFLIKPSGFTMNEDTTIKNFSALNQFDIVYPSPARKARIEGLDYGEILGSLADTKKREKVASDHTFDIRPTTDDRPFFNYFMKIGKIKEIYMLSGKKWSYFLHEGMALPFLVALLALVASAIFTATFVRAKRRIHKAGKGLFPGVSYFALIGFAFMFVEVYFLHTLILPLGSPAEALSIVLVTLLLSAGAGSMTSGFVAAKRLMPFMYLLPLLLVCYAVLFQKVVLSEWSFLAIAPIGMFLGFFFPFGIRTLSKEDPAAIPLAYAMNGAASIVSPVLASLIAVEYGLTVLLILAAILYTAVLTMVFRVHSSNVNSFAQGRR
ncbi:MAG TPA: hypothetical protein PLX02_09675 [Syntrophorhabdaceae bacterium]|nr:hypothetical protein [Syntrophorhabdaceae bacterium]HQM81877.1 hypothetical protein [Syntrophorhabdaceae bacterium]